MSLLSFFDCELVTGCRTAAPLPFPEQQSLQYRRGPLRPEERCASFSLFQCLIQQTAPHDPLDKVVGVRSRHPVQLVGANRRLGRGRGGGRLQGRQDTSFLGVACDQGHGKRFDVSVKRLNVESLSVSTVGMRHTGVATNPRWTRTSWRAQDGTVSFTSGT